MKSEPPTPNRAPDSLFRKVQDELNHIRDTSFLNLLGFGVGCAYSIGEVTGVRSKELTGASRPGFYRSLNTVGGELKGVFCKGAPQCCHGF